ncbi:translesion DNA synthesis-associated protein ImuA [Acidovorax sp. NCPPB 3576]|uniref:translesion DNA synthesis-associated protein ImuA n=1 Tax=Acidovorax sp. NCPPB 3576 TaxID=2940488 RepID=UPI00234AA1C9|nr:translesion DNA synthesis-associated protein ImuA [Acidovorax sp. NCPPB 3576]WCM86274.1 translesion DNA synthesis-associated protein ImuA [Acidovorax sp. NCPPB 3576]
MSRLALASLPPGAAARRESAARLELPGVWQGDALTAQHGRVQPSGHALLDAALPGGGWPLGAMTEVLQPPQGGAEWPLVLPALARAAAQRGGQVVLVAPPAEPFAPALQAAGLPADRLCRVRPLPSRHDQSAAWASEQALRCRDVLAVLAWLPQAPPEALRRLQLAAAQQAALLWVFRPQDLRLQASPAPLRLWVVQGVQAIQGIQGAEGSPAFGRAQGLPAPAQVPGWPDGGRAPGVLQVHVLKRRGPPLMQPVPVCAHASALSAVLAAMRALKARRFPGDASAPAVQRPVPGAPQAMVALQERVHALDRRAFVAG